HFLPLVQRNRLRGGGRRGPGNFAYSGPPARGRRQGGLTITIRTFLIKVYFAGIAIASLFAIAWRLSFANHLKLIDGLSTVQDWLWPTSFFLMPLQSGDSLSECLSTLCLKG